MMNNNNKICENEKKSEKKRYIEWEFITRHIRGKTEFTLSVKREEINEITL